MATYNGEKYIEEQLRSICEQTVQPNEIIVSDDGSSDKTVEIVRSMTEQYPTIRFTAVLNKGEHGYVPNFDNALKYVTSDYVFLSDQDDRWNPQKIETIVSFISKYPNTECIFHNYEAIGSDGQLIYYENDMDQYCLECVSGGGIRFHVQNG